MSLLTVVPLMTAGTAHARQTTREPAHATTPLSDSFAGLSLPEATRIVDAAKVATATRMLNGSLAPKYHGERLEAIRLTTTPADAASVAAAGARISAALRHAGWSVTEGERQTNANGGIGNALLMFKPSSPPISGFVIGSVRGIALVWAETHDGPASATGAAVTPAMAPNASASRTAAADTPALPTPTIHLPKLTSRPGYIMGRAVFENGAQSPTSRWKEMPTAPRVTPAALP